MARAIRFIVDYEVEGVPVVYKVDEETINVERSRDGGFELNMGFNMHVATEEELKEYKER